MKLDLPTPGRNTFLYKIMYETAVALGAKLEILSWSVAGFLVFSDGIKVAFERNHNDFTGSGINKISRNKYITHILLEQTGFQIPLTKRTRLASFHDLETYKKAICDTADKVNFPIFIKPNDQGMGNGVYRAETKIDLQNILTDRFLVQYQDVIVQPVISGVDIRVIVYQGKIFGAMVREPLSVVGDGVATIEFLLAQKRMKSSIKVFDNDRITKKLNKYGYALTDILAQDEKIYLLDNANISSGGIPIDCAHTLHDSYKEEVLRAARVLGVEFGGIDVLVEGDYRQEGATMIFLEVNAPCGLSGYASLGDEQYTKVKDLYINMFDTMHKRKQIT